MYYPHSKATTTLEINEIEKDQKYSATLTVLHERSVDGIIWENRNISFFGEGGDKVPMIISLSQQAQDYLRSIEFDLFNLLDAREQGFIK
jgi:hypothetical protein